MTEVKVILSDIQYPFHNKKAVENVRRFIEVYRPNEVLCVGDEIDSPQVARWTKGQAGEYEGTLQQHIDGCHEMMAAFREAAGRNTPFHVMRSNHGDRLETYIRKYAAALQSIRALTIENLLGYPGLGIEYHHQPFEIAPNWVLAHGDEGGLSQIAGTTALALAKRMGRSVAIGHTHRLALKPESVGLNGRVHTIFGFEVGHLMDLSQATYLGFGAANWMTGFGILYVDGKNVTPVAVPIHRDNSFLVEGKRYG